MSLGLEAVSSILVFPIQTRCLMGQLGSMVKSSLVCVLFVLAAIATLYCCCGSVAHACDSGQQGGVSDNSATEYLKDVSRSIGSIVVVRSERDQGLC